MFGNASGKFCKQERGQRVSVLFVFCIKTVFLRVIYTVDSRYHELLAIFNKIRFPYSFQLFASAFPLAPLIALLTNAIDMKVDARRLLWTNRRPVAFRAEDIGW